MKFLFPGALQCESACPLEPQPPTKSPTPERRWVSLSFSQWLPIVPGSLGASFPFLHVCAGVLSGLRLCCTCACCHLYFEFKWVTSQESGRLHWGLGVQNLGLFCMYLCFGLHLLPHPHFPISHSLLWLNMYLPIVSPLAFHGVFYNLPSLNCILLLVHV